MLRKLSVIAAIVAALLIPGAAMAGKHGGGHGGHRGGHHGHWKGGHAHWNGGRHYNKRWYGHRGYKNYGRGHGRWWGGRWYAYGIGSCWRWAPGGWVWVCY